MAHGGNSCVTFMVKVSPSALPHLCGVGYCSETYVVKRLKRSCKRQVEMPLLAGDIVHSFDVLQSSRYRRVSVEDKTAEYLEQFSRART
jgi:hypothetical protein